METNTSKQDPSAKQDIILFLIENIREIRQDIKMLNNKMDKQAETLNNKMDKQAETLNNKMDKQAETLNNKMERHINMVDNKVTQLIISMNTGFRWIVGVFIATMTAIGLLMFSWFMESNKRYSDLHAQVSTVVHALDLIRSGYPYNKPQKPFSLKQRTVDQKQALDKAPEEQLNNNKTAQLNK